MANGQHMSSETKTETSKTKLSDSFGGTIEEKIPEDVVWIDNCFYVKKTRFMYVSILKEPLGQHFITGLTEEVVTKVTRWHLKALQDGSIDDNTRVVNDGFVGGKL